MSFVEDNKIWLLPCLGVGCLGVMGMNLWGGGRRGSAPSPSSKVSAPTTVQPLAGTGTPNDNLNADPLLLAGLHPLGEDLRNQPSPPSLHPDQWRELSQVLPEPAPNSQRLPAVPPVADFIIERGGTQEAWISGRGYRVGDTLPGGYALKGITATGILVSRPAEQFQLRPKPNPSFLEGVSTQDPPTEAEAPS